MSVDATWTQFFLWGEWCEGTRMATHNKCHTHTHTTYHVSSTIKWCHPQNLHVSYFSRLFLNKKIYMLVIHGVICQSKRGYLFGSWSPTAWFVPFGPLSEVARSRRFGSKPPHWCQNSGPSLNGGKGKGCDVGERPCGCFFWMFPNFWMSKIHKNPRWWENMSGGTKEIFGGMDFFICSGWVWWFWLVFFVSYDYMVGAYIWAGREESTSLGWSVWGPPPRLLSQCQWNEIRSCCYPSGGHPETLDQDLLPSTGLLTSESWISKILKISRWKPPFFFLAVVCWGEASCFL